MPSQPEKIKGDLPGALKLFQDGLRVAQEIGDPWYAALCLTEVVGVRMWMGEADDIHEQFVSAVDAWRKTGDLRFTAFGLNSLGLGAVTVGKYDEARAALEESVAINTAVGDRWGLANAYLVVGMAEQAQEFHTQALDVYRQSLQILTDLGARWEVARVLSEMGRSTFAIGNDSEAERLWYEALQLSMETQGTPTTLEAIVGIANLRAIRRKHRDALRLLLFSISHPAIITKTKIQSEQVALTLKEQLTASRLPR